MKKGSKKSRNKHLRKKRAKKLLNALCEMYGPAGEPEEIDGRTKTYLYNLGVGDIFFINGKEYQVADNDIVGGFIACINEAGEQEWLPEETEV